MSNISYDWIVLGVAAILFAVLSFLKRKKNAEFTARVLLATVFGIILGIAFKGHTDYVGAAGSIWSNAITALVVPLLLFSIISSITNLGESIRLKNIGRKPCSSCYLTPRRLRCLR
ncbi:cation:dicarboxylate symporter family transporter [Bifidobacterium catenulatum]|uniref:cation:dicarboxylate symporter family transporter n=1 Tax=Bifidobacterium catenulatum TaxID=1686 RepID=UPI0024805740|nr:cation:dicarboxylase symporter family transporter [Bifidobacterium catenulatum]